MTAEHASTIDRPLEETRTPLIGEIASAILALVLVVSIGTWQISRGMEHASTATATPERTSAAPRRVATPAAGAGATTLSLTVYLVGTQEEADALNAELNAADPAQGVWFEQAWFQAVLVVPSDEQAGRMLGFIAHINTLRQVEGMPPIRVIDHRADAANRADQRATPTPVSDQ